MGKKKDVVINDDNFVVIMEALLGITQQDYFEARRVIDTATRNGPEVQKALRVTRAIRRFEQESPLMFMLGEYLPQHGSLFETAYLKALKCSQVPGRLVG